MAQSRDFQSKRAANLAGTTTDAQAFKTADDSTKIVSLIVPANAKVFRVRASGTATGGTTTNFTIAIYKGTSATASSDTLLAGHAATAYNSASGGFLLEATVHYDSVNSKLHGSKRGFVGTTPTVLADTIITDLTSITAANVAAGLPLCIFGTFSATDAANVAVLDSFSLEVLETIK